MKFVYLLCYHRSQVTSTNTRRSIGSIRFLVLSAVLLALLLTGCSTLAGEDTQSQPANVNFFGTAANHVHYNLIAFPNNVLVLPTHYGLFRSADAGRHWALVAFGPDQGLMTNWLVASPLSQQRLYVMTYPAVANHKGVVGVYTSADQGYTWKLTITAAQLGDSNANFFVQPGNESPNQVYVYVHKLGAQGLKVSKDAGQHFTTPGTLPFGSIEGLLALPGAPGTLLAYGFEGIARSTDGGTHWNVIAGMSQQAVLGMTTGSSNRPIYASADQGIYASQDGGKSFTLVHPGASYSSLTASPVDPQLVYGKTSSTIFRSTDGGHTWKALPPPTGSHGSLWVLAADPTNPSLLYLALNYPTEVYRYDQDNGNNKPWTSLTPQAEQQADTLQNSIMPVVYVMVAAVLLVVLIILFRRYTKARIKRRKGQ